LIVEEGDRRTDFIVQKVFACFYSPVFREAFASELFEGQRQNYRLKDTIKDAVRLFSLWLYRKKLESNTLNEAWDGKNKNSEEYYDRIDKDEMGLVDLWLLADQLSVPRLQNAAIENLDKLYVKHSCNFPPVRKSTKTIGGFPNCVSLSS
jgi:hypothetical protein